MLKAEQEKKGKMLTITYVHVRKVTYDSKCKWGRKVVVSFPVRCKNRKAIKYHDQKLHDGHLKEQWQNYTTHH